MSNTINVVTGAGLTLTAKIWSGNTQIGSSIAMTESSGQSGFYYASTPVTIADGTYMIICTDGSGNIKAFGEAQFIDNNLQNGDFTKEYELWQSRGLDINNPATTTTTNLTVGDINVAITGDGTTTTTMTRQP